MQQVIQNVRTGALTLAEIPAPLVQPGEVLIANAASLVSAGTEKMILDLAKKSLLGKARARPDQVRRVIEKIRNEGFFSTLRQVRAKLDEPMPMGYASAGVVLACGAGVQEYKPGDRVASNGPHAGIVSVPRHLCAPIPESVSFEAASFGVLGAIALQGVRLAKVELGATVLVVGLGLVGQLTVALLRASGARVLGTDPDPARCELALRMGATVAEPGLRGDAVAARTGGLGADAVLLTASTESQGPIRLAAEAVRKKGRIVLVGVVGLELDRRPFYFKECEFVVSCSYGPGRYDAAYEERGQDYPAAYVRWTEQRNLAAVLELMGAGRLDVMPLITHRFPIAAGEAAYELIASRREPYLGVVLTYPEVAAEPARRIELRAAPATGDVSRAALGVGCIGAGNFARLVLLPAIQKRSELTPRVLCSGRGLSAADTGERMGFAAVATDAAAVRADPTVQALFVLTRHDDHAEQIVAGLAAGKHLFVEKPLALTLTECERVAEAVAAAPTRLLMVGFNRRFSPAARAVGGFFQGVAAPKTVQIRFNAGAIPADHWTQDDAVGGGRIIGEACHAIDLATYLTGAPVTRVFAESIGGPAAPAITDDQTFLTLRHADGSISSVAYLAGGDKAMPKERVEIHGGGRSATIEDWRKAEGWSGGKRSILWRGGQAKGHAEEIAAFAEAARGGGAWPIPWTELWATSAAAILAVQSLREGLPFEVPAPPSPPSPA